MNQGPECEYNGCPLTSVVHMNWARFAAIIIGAGVVTSLTERRRSEDLPEKVAPGTRFPQIRRNFATFREVCFASARNFGLILVRLLNVDYVYLVVS